MSDLSEQRLLCDPLHWTEGMQRLALDAQYIPLSEDLLEHWFEHATRPLTLPATTAPAFPAPPPASAWEGADDLFIPRLNAIFTSGDTQFIKLNHIGLHDAASMTCLGACSCARDALLMLGTSDRAGADRAEKPVIVARKWRSVPEAAEWRIVVANGHAKVAVQRCYDLVIEGLVEKKEETEKTLYKWVQEKLVPVLGDLVKSDLAVDVILDVDGKVILVDVAPLEDADLGLISHEDAVEGDFRLILRSETPSGPSFRRQNPFSHFPFEISQSLNDPEMSKFVQESLQKAMQILQPQN